MYPYPYQSNGNPYPVLDAVMAPVQQPNSYPPYYNGMQNPIGSGSSVPQPMMQQQPSPYSYPMMPPMANAYNPAFPYQNQMNVPAMPGGAPSYQLPYNYYPVQNQNYPVREPVHLPEIAPPAPRPQEFPPGNYGPWTPRQYPPNMGYMDYSRYPYWGY